MAETKRPKDAFIVGERVWLRMPTEDDAVESWYDWFNDEDVARYTGWWKPNTPEKQLSFLNGRVKQQDDIILAIIESETNKHIGIVSLSNINFIHRFADIALIVGDEAARSKANLGFEAFALMIRYAFLKLNLLNIKGGYIEGQDHSAKILQALRFKNVGRIEKLYTIDGTPRDQVLVQLNRETWLVRNSIA